MELTNYSNSFIKPENLQFFNLKNFSAETKQIIAVISLNNAEYRNQVWLFLTL